MSHGPLVLAIDVGNSRIKCGLLEPADRLPDCRCAAAVAVDEEIPWSVISGWIEATGVVSLNTVISGSNATRMQQVVESWPAEAPPLSMVIDDYRRLPLTVDLSEPAGVGIDRLLSAVAANRLRPSGRAAIIVDCGTATTVDIVSDEGAFAGGAILPGMQLSARALHRHTDQLPPIDTASLTGAPENCVGRNTIDAIHSGLYWGQIGAIRELVKRMSTPFTSPLILLTGGGGASVQPHIAESVYEPDLALQGLALTALAANGAESASPIVDSRPRK